MLKGILISLGILVSLHLGYGLYKHYHSIHKNYVVTKLHKVDKPIVILKKNLKKEHIYCYVDGRCVKY